MWEKKPAWRPLLSTTELGKDRRAVCWEMRLFKALSVRQEPSLGFGCGGWEGWKGTGPEKQAEAEPLEQLATRHWERKLRGCED